jgi:hypothetical protein
MRVPFLGQSYEGRTPYVSAQRSINLMFEKAPEDASSVGTMVTTPGEVAWATAGSGAGARGIHVMYNELYVIYGDTLYHIDTGGTTTTIGIVEGTERVVIANNGTQMVIVSDEKTYYYTRTTSTFAQITDTSFLQATSVAYLDGYFVFTQYQTNQWFISPLMDDITGEVDFTAFDATDRARAFTSPGNCVAVVADHKELWFFKEDDFIEIWQNTGEADFPFSRLGGAYIQRGCKLKHTITQNDNTLIWVGEDNIIYRANGYIPERVSNFAVENEIASASFTNDMFAQTWEERGHKLYGIWLPSEGKTLILDIGTGLWHERQSFGYGYWRVNGIAKCYGKWVVTDSESSTVGELDFDVFQEYGSLKQAIRIGQTIQAEGAWFSLDRFEVFCEAGVGLISGQGSDPKIGLSLSKNHGKSYGTQKVRSLGKMGDYTERAVWRQQGLYKQVTPKVLISDPVRRYIVDAYAEITPRSV